MDQRKVQNHPESKYINIYIETITRSTNEMTIQDFHGAAEPEIPILAPPAPTPDPEIAVHVQPVPMAIAVPSAPPLAPTVPVVYATTVPPEPVKMEADARPDYTNASAPPPPPGPASNTFGAGVGAMPKLGMKPVRISGKCKHCGKEDQLTRLTSQPSMLAYGCCVTLFCVFWPICWVPFVLPQVS